MTDKKEAPKAEKQKAPKPAEQKKTAVNYIHAALLLHSAGKDITAAALAKVVQAAGVSPDDAQVKSLVASLEGVNIDEAVKQAVAAPAAAAAPAAGEAKKEEKKEEAPEKKPEEAAAGLSSLFG